MQHLDKLWKVISAAGTVRDLAQEAKTLRFQVQPPTTLYLHAEHSAVTVRRHDEPTIIIDVTLQAGFGWRLVSDQDDAGVYIVAKRRTLVGSISRAQFLVTVPHDTHLVLRLEPGSVTLDDVNTLLEVPPLTNEVTYIQAPKNLPRLKS